MKILLLGKTGQIGGALAKRLRTTAEMTEPERQTLDLADGEAIRRTVADAHPDLIINAAAYTDVEGAEDDPSKAELINATAPGILAEEAKKCGAALIHFSTDYIFDGTQATPYDEDAPPEPCNVYGRSKLLGEVAIRETGAAHVVFRSSWIYDVRGRNFLLTILRLAQREEVLRVVDDQFGAPTPATVVAETVAEIIAQTQNRPVEFFKDKGGIINLTCRGCTTWRDFAQSIVDRARRHGMTLSVQEVRGIPSSEYWGKAARPKNSRLDLSRLQKRFGLTTPEWEPALDNVFSDFDSLGLMP
ncbi:MAG: dTDP-4-dehydrorhamnose reductase [Proteobacteria bacterium]|nr:dTDP-4-dehydrorhamnose reductase [Pseudomonadota bacterium]